MFMWLWYPGQMVCAYFGITGEHRMIARAFINTHWYGHFAVWLAVIYAKQFPAL